MNWKRVGRMLKTPAGLVAAVFLVGILGAIVAVTVQAPWETLALTGGILLPALGITELIEVKHSYEAAEDLSDYQYHIVVLDATSGKIRLPDAATDVPYGVLQNAPESGEPCTVAPLGCGSISKVVANDALAIGTVVALEYVGAADAGKAQTASNAQYRVGVVVEASSAEDDLCGVLLMAPSLPALLVTDLALADGKIIIGGAGGAGAAQTPSGDVTITNAGVTAIGAKKVVAAMTAIADGKILIGGAGGAGAEQTLSGDVTVTNTGVTAIGADKVAHAMLKANAVETDNITDANVTAAKQSFWLPGNNDVAADTLAIPVTKTHVSKTTGADAEALTLANGVAGQVLVISLVVDGGGDGTLTPTTASGWSTIVFADKGDIAALLYVNDAVGWVILGTAGVAAPPVTSLV